LSIKGAEARHINRVLRMAPGDMILLMDAKGSRCEAVIESACRHAVHVRIAKTLAPPIPSPIEITLCQALLKAKAMDFVIQKASELGVHEILPFASERTVVRTDPDKHAAKTGHWREIAVNASKQSNRHKPPEVRLPCSMPQLFERWRGKNALKLILWEDENARDLKSLLRGSVPLQKVVGIIGPEGGFSAEEVMSIRQGGFYSVSLGRRVLRAETAAISFVAILQYEWGDLSLQEWSNGVVE
jgi:16S rRNA (uracil1498-N3)-methyltransferase